jgi:hypothetical protein
MRAMLRRDRVKIPTDWQAIERIKPREGHGLHLWGVMYKATCGGLMHSAWPSGILNLNLRPIGVRFNHEWRISLILFRRLILHRLQRAPFHPRFPSKNDPSGYPQYEKNTVGMLHVLQHLPIHTRK